MNAVTVNERKRTGRSIRSSKSGRLNHPSKAAEWLKERRSSPEYEAQRKLDDEKWNQLRAKPALQARQALDHLFRAVTGETSLSERILRDNEVGVSGGDSVAAEEYAKLVCEQVERLNGLISTHLAHLLPVSRKRFDWPILKSEHPVLSQDENEILAALQVGKETGRYFDRFSKWRPNGNIAFVVDELLCWVDACKNPPGPTIYSPGNRRLRMVTGIERLYTRDGKFCEHPLLSRLSRYLRPHEVAAAKLQQLAKDTIPAWEKFFQDLVTDCFKDEDCATYLTRCFVAAKSRTKQKRGRGFAKEYLIRKVRERLKIFAGVKR